jgi:catechol 2,3-dioxygenase-like lactoylglutathione lyase family enzyme
MITNAKYVHTNLITLNWKKLAEFYENVFGCVRIPPERNLSGKWIDDATEIPDVHINGVHLRLPGYEGNYPTLEIFQYNVIEKNEERKINHPGFGHIAFLVDDVHFALKEIISHDGSKLGEIVETQIPGVGFLTFVYAKDPDGNFIELQSWKK